MNLWRVHADWLFYIEYCNKYYGECVPIQRESTYSYCMLFERISKFGGSRVELKEERSAAWSVRIRQLHLFRDLRTVGRTVGRLWSTVGSGPRLWADGRRWPVVSSGAQPARASPPEPAQERGET